MKDFRSTYYLFFDTEFADFSNLSPLSIAVVSEDKNFEFYQEVNDFVPSACSDFVHEFVIPLLNLGQYGMPYKLLSEKLIKWINDLPCNDVIFITNYAGDITILERLLSLQGEAKLSKKFIVKMVSKAFNIATIERGLYDHRTIHKGFQALSDGINLALAQYPNKRHHALYDVMAVCDAWRDAMQVLKATLD